MEKRKKRIERRTAVRIWRWISPGVNNPKDCAPSDWLIGRLAESVPADRISDEIWKIARRALKLRFPGLDRPLGSCFFPGVGNVLDVAFHYGKATQRVLRKVAATAATIAHASDGLWVIEEVSGHGDDDHPTGTKYVPPTARRKQAHICVCPWCLGCLAQAVRDGQAPTVGEISPPFFKADWEAACSKKRRRDEVARQKAGALADLLLELKVSLFETEAPRLKVWDRWYDQRHCPQGQDTIFWVTDGKKTEVNSEIIEPAFGLFNGGGQDECRIENATYAFSVRYLRGYGRRVDTVFAWPGSNLAAVARALKKALRLAS